MKIQTGGSMCTLCRSPGTTKITCPLNPESKHPNNSKHPLAKQYDVSSQTHKQRQTSEKLPHININQSSHIDKAERVKRLKEHLTLSAVKHEDQIMKLSTLKEAHIYCIIRGVSAQQYGPLLERFIRIKFNYVKNKAEDCTGDCSKDGQNSEVKVSLGGSKHTKFNFVQIRPLHDCDTYIFTAYHLSYDNVESEGELYIFKVPKSEIKKIIVKFGGYAHGTRKEHGEISVQSMSDDKIVKEYALRPSINDDCWNTLMAFRIQERDL